MKQVNQPPKKPARFSLVTRLNTRLFFRLMGIYLGMNLLLAGLFCGGVFVWSEQRCAQVATLVGEQGMPGAEAAAWMQVGSYALHGGDAVPAGIRVPGWFPTPPETKEGTRYFNPGQTGRLFFGEPNSDGPAAYHLLMPGGGAPYTVTLDLSEQMRFFVVTAWVLAVVELLSLVCNLFKNADTIRRTLRPIEDLAAAAAKLGTVSTMSPEELQMLASKLGEINATHLDTRISVPGTQRELKTIAEAINAMLDRINEAYSSQMRFVSDASHELRTPIAVIQGYANMLNRWGKDDPAARQEAIDAITAEAAAMKELMEQLLFLARGDNDSMHVALAPLDLTAVAAEVLRETEMIDRTHIFSAQWDGGVTVSADGGLMKQALRILVDNSIKYTPSGGHIRLTVGTEGGMARLSVQDEGQGINAEALPHIFDRFYRTDQSRTRQTGGTGLGLAIAKWIVDRHGGFFEVVSHEGIGTRVTVVLPLVKAQARPKDEVQAVQKDDVQDEKPA